MDSYPRKKESLARGGDCLRTVNYKFKGKLPLFLSEDFNSSKKRRKYEIIALCISST